MADEDKKDTLPATADEGGIRGDAPSRLFSSSRSSARSVQGNQKNKLAVIPFSVLLPEAGDLRQLVLFQAALEARYAKLLQSESSGEEEPRKRLAEQHMLGQVVEWLSLNRGES